MRRLIFYLLGLLLASVPCWAQQPEFGNYNTPALVTLTAAGAGTTDSPDQFNRYGKGLQLNVNISAKTGTIAVTVAVQGKDTVSGVYYPLCTSASLTAVGFTSITVYPGITQTANLDCDGPLPATWRVEVVSGAGVTPAVTMTVSASILM